MKRLVVIVGKKLDIDATGMKRPVVWAANKGVALVFKV